MESVSNVFRPYKPDFIIFIFQVLIIFIVVCTSLVNLSLNIGNTDLWTMLLTCSLGYMMPNPRFKIDLKANTSVKTQTPDSNNEFLLRNLTVERPESSK